MYDPPIVKNGVKIYRMHHAYRKRGIITFLCIIVACYLMILGMSLNAKSPTDNIFAWVLSGVLIIFVLWFVYRSFIFRLELTERGGTIHDIGTSIQFDWSDVKKLDYVDWVDENLNLNELCLKLTKSTAKRAIELPTIFFLPFPFNENLIPVSILHHRKSFWDPSTKAKLPTKSEYQNHMQHFLDTDIGQDIIRYAPQTLTDVVGKYLPGNDLKRGI